MKITIPLCIVLSLLIGYFTGASVERHIAVDNERMQTDLILARANVAGWRGRFFELDRKLIECRARELQWHLNTTRSKKKVK